MATTFEESFLKALDAAKPTRAPRIRRGEKKYITINTEWGQYEFAHTDPRKGWEAGKVNITGPVFGRTGKVRNQLGNLGTFDLRTGKLDLWEKGRYTRIYTESALDQFLRKVGGATAGLFGWDVQIYKEGWGRVLKAPKPGKKYVKEIAVFGAQMPGRKIVYYNPSGKRRLQYSEYSKIPSEVSNYIATQLAMMRIWDDLYNQYLDANRGVRYPQRRKSVNTWENGPGSKYF